MEKRFHRSMHDFVPPFNSHCLDKFQERIGIEMQRSAAPALCRYDEIGHIITQRYTHCCYTETNPCREHFPPHEDCGCDEHRHPDDCDCDDCRKRREECEEHDDDEHLVRRPAHVEVVEERPRRRTRRNDEE